MHNSEVLNCLLDRTKQTVMVHFKGNKHSDIIQLNSSDIPNFPRTLEYILEKYSNDKVYSISRLDYDVYCGIVIHEIYNHTYHSLADNKNLCKLKRINYDSEDSTVEKLEYTGYVKYDLRVISIENGNGISHFGDYFVYYLELEDGTQLYLDDDCTVEKI